MLPSDTATSLKIALDTHVDMPCWTVLVLCRATMLLAVQALREQGIALAEAQERVERLTQDMHAILGEHPP